MCVRLLIIGRGRNAKVSIEAYLPKKLLSNLCKLLLITWHVLNGKGRWNRSLVTLPNDDNFFLYFFCSDGFILTIIRMLVKLLNRLKHLLTCPNTFIRVDCSLIFLLSDYSIRGCHDVRRKTSARCTDWLLVLYSMRLLRRSSACPSSRSHGSWTTQKRTTAKGRSSFLDYR